jgi:hypothetical protein
MRKPAMVLRNCGSKSKADPHVQETARAMRAEKSKNADPSEQVGVARGPPDAFEHPPSPPPDVRNFVSFLSLLRTKELPAC